MTAIDDTDEDLAYAPEVAVTASNAKPWKLLIADDDADIHQVTQLALIDQTVEGRPIEFIHAYSGREAIAALEREPDIAMVLLDVVMERETAGLDAVEAIRNKLNNRQVRIVLRTGQPGQAPEREIVLRYDINDYKEKTELTAKKLFTLVHTTLSQYRIQRDLARSRAEMRRLAEAAPGLFCLREPGPLAQALLEVLAGLLDPGHARGNGACAGLVVDNSRAAAPQVIAGIGAMTSLVGKPLDKSALGRVLERLAAIDMENSWQLEDGYFVADIIGQKRQGLLIYIESSQPLERLDRETLEVYCRNAAAAFDSL